MHIQYVKHVIIPSVLFSCEIYASSSIVLGSERGRKD